MTWTHSLLINNMSNGAKQKVVEILKTQGSITNWYAIDHRITTRLSSIIERLRKQGWIINTEIEDNKNCTYRVIYAPNDLKMSLETTKPVQRTLTGYVELE